ncbi:MAG: App1 family protein [Mariniblastus sp.]
MIRIGRSKDSTSALLAYSGFGYPVGEEWRVHTSGVVWQTPVVFSMRQRMMIRMLGGVMQASPEELSGETFQTRITPFMADAHHRQSIIVTMNNKSFRLRKRTRKNGQFSDWLCVKKRDIESAITTVGGRDTIKFSAHIDGSKTEPAEGIIYLLPESGIGVVSDIDDTIKDSSVGDRRELLANTFLREFRSIDGMAEVYRKWANDGASFHYVSSSPWQLYPCLQQLHSEHGFPLGTMHLRNFRLRDQLLKRVIIRRQGKATAIRTLMKNLPKRRFLLIGDSGEKDPKIYRKICRQFPQQIQGVFIRNLPHRPLENERFQKLSSAIPHGKCATFKTADELSELAGELTG